MPLEKQDIARHFTERFGHPPRWIVRAPGRVNLIGEHTDYNDGFVLPLAIDRAVWLGLRPRDDCHVMVHSIDYQQSADFDLSDLRRGKATWIEYLKGVAWSLQDTGRQLKGWEGVLAGDVPLGAGLSSSAALEMATARAFSAASGFDWDPAVMAKLGQRAENQWIGVNCGIMDQLISAAGKEGHALLIDCRSLQTQPAPLPRGVAVVVLDTATRRGLVNSAYNERRSQCEAAAHFFLAAEQASNLRSAVGQVPNSPSLPAQIKALRDVTPEMYQHKADGLDEVTRRRARHVITENDRTLHAVEAMRRGDVKTLGKLMNESHVSLRDDYEVSSEALNVMVEAAQAHPACYGARMTGAGFGGCAVAIVRTTAADDFVQATSAAYSATMNRAPAVYVCRATNGAEEVLGLQS